MKMEFTFGDKLEALDWHKEEHGIEYVTITGINQQTQVYYWEADLNWELGGKLSSGYYFKDAKAYKPKQIAREYNSPIIQELLDEITPEEMEATEQKMLQEIKDNNSPYCPVCDGCGEDLCCPATFCQQHPDGSYCNRYLKDLKFDYKMNRWIADNLYHKMPKELQAEYDLAWDKIYKDYE
jgi:hypothetical protein